MATGSVVDHTRELVVLVHGLWMPGAASSLLGLRLRKLGFDTANFSYPSVRSTLDEAAVRLGRFVAAHRSPRVHFVGHSLGGLVVMTMLHGSNIRSLGRAVLLGSPCNGCAAAVQLAGRRGWSMLLGRA
ncbi:MAG TPA: alpha/beta fold hydrolase, partial [Burkholderiales bacterium]|nr:alpha/beta fold hydrolase [Burkholderiales bacterium]